MKLEDKLADIFRQELKIIIEREKNEPEYLNADYYATNEDRASAGIHEATGQVVKYAALLCAKHRQKKHGDTVEAEIKQLTTEINEEYLDKEVVSEWWNL